MNYYNVKELKNQLTDRVLGLGIDKRFLENPAFSKSIAQIYTLISGMNMGQAMEAVTVIEENGNISFQWSSSFGDKYSMSISSPNPETFACVMTEEKSPYIARDGQTVREKSAREYVTTIDERGGITFTDNFGVADDIDCERYKCYLTSSAEKTYYTPNGVANKSDYKCFPRMEYSSSVHSMSSDEILYVSRDDYLWPDKYEKRTILERNKFDTARMFQEDKAEGITYSAIVPLFSNDHVKLSDMVPYTKVKYPQDVVIPPLSQEEIETMIQQESNPKVREGLRAYAVGRDTYSYNSAEDRDFIREGVSESQSMSR